jgi:hypothetical protein
MILYKTCFIAATRDEHKRIPAEATAMDAKYIGNTGFAGTTAVQS